MYTVMDTVNLISAIAVIFLFRVFGADFCDDCTTAEAACRAFWGAFKLKPGSSAALPEAGARLFCLILNVDLQVKTTEGS